MIFMRRYVIFILSFSLTFLAQANFYAVEICPQLNQGDFIRECKEKGYVVVDLKNEGYFLVETEDFHVEEDLCYVTKVSLIESHLAFNTNELLIRVKDENFRNREDTLKELGLDKHPIIPNLYKFKSEAKSANDLEAVMTFLYTHSFVSYISVKQVFTMVVSTNDPLYNRQWSIENNGTSIQSGGTPDADMQVDSAWTINEGSSSIKIAILDSGVDTLHEDLISNMLPGFDGYATDSTNTKGFPTPNFSNDGHGTACAGIVAAEANNNIGVAGIAHGCKIIPIRIFYYQDYGGAIGIQATTNTDALVSGFAFAWRIANADILSTSAGLSPLFIGALGINQTLANEEINEAYWSGRSGYGVPMFFSAGNDDFNDVLWPADLPTTIAVGASSMCDERKNPNDCSPENWGSSYGEMLDIVAPGVRIASTDMMGANGYSSTNYTTSFNGTSASCPNAAGVGALILSVSPGLHARDVKAVLNQTADRVGGYNYDSTTIHGTWNLEMGHGRVNAFKALELAQTFESTVGVGIKERNEEIDFRIFPNPNTGSFTLQSLYLGVHAYDLFDIHGRKLHHIAGNEQNMTLDLKLSSGTYFLRSLNGGQYIKFIVF